MTWKLLYLIGSLAYVFLVLTLINVIEAYPGILAVTMVASFTVGAVIRGKERARV